MEKCALYLVRDGRTGATKIGISNDPERRLGQISSSYYVSSAQIIKTTWFTSREEAQRWETNFHRKYAAQRSDVQGGREWFNLPDIHVQNFIEWMQASSDRRALKVLNLEATVKKKPEQLQSDRFSRGFFVAFGGSIFFIAALSMGEFGIFFLLVAAVLMAAYTAPTETSKSSIYLLDGKLLNDNVVPASEYKAMNLWEEKKYQLKGVKSHDWNFPASITKEQASDFYAQAYKSHEKGPARR